MNRKKNKTTASSHLTSRNTLSSHKIKSRKAGPSEKAYVIYREAYNYEPKAISVITSALSGMTGGGILLSFLGPAGAITGGIVGAVVTGYSEIVNQKNAAKKEAKEGVQIVKKVENEEMEIANLNE
jgi:hypothetical protein